MSVGHGATGLRDRLRPWRDLQVDESHSRRPYVDLQLGKDISGGGNWVIHAGSIQKTTLTATSLTYAGIVRAVVGVESMIAPRPLARRERIADMVAGTWYYDDSALVAGGSTDLYVWLPDSSDPDSTTVVLLLLFTIGTKGEVYPIRGPERSPDPGLNAWASGTDLTNYTEDNVGATGVAITQETANVFEGTSAARVAPGASGLAAGGSGGIQITGQVGVVGAHYLLSSAYWTSPDLNTDLSAAFRIKTVAAVALYMLPDGINDSAATADCLIRPTVGEWRRAMFIFRCTTDTTTLQADFRLHNSGAGARSGGYVLFDDTHFFRIWRYSLYVPGLDASSVAATEAKSAHVLFGPVTLSIGGVSLLDGDGSIAKALASLLPFNRVVQVFYGGSFSNGDEVYRDDWRAVSTSIIRKPAVRDGSITIDVEDAHSLALIRSLQKTDRIGDLPNMAPSQEGLPKALLFGETSEFIIEGTRVDVDGNGYGYYEFLDPTVPVADAVAVTLPASYSIKVYPNKQLADDDLQGYQITDSTNDFTVATQNTRWHVLRDIRNYRYDKSGNDVGTGASFDCNTVASGNFSVNLDISGPAYKVAADLQAGIRAVVGGTTVTVIYTESTHKFTVNRTGAVVLNILPQSGVNSHKKSWALLGYDTRLDHGISGGVGAVAENVTFTDPDVDHIIRFVGGGYKDDAAGSICGVASVALDTPPAVASWILQKVCRVPPAMVDVAGSFKSARDGCLLDFAQLFAYLDGGDQAVAALAWLSQTGLMALQVGGDGIWRCKKYASRLVAITSSNSGTDQVLTAIHGLTTGEEVFIKGHTGSVPDINGRRTVTVIDTTHFTIGVDITTGGTGGSLVKLRGLREFFDRDYLSWEMWNEPSSIFKAVKIYGAYRPALKRFMTYADAAGVIDTGIPVKHGAEGIFEVTGYLTRGVITGGTQKISNYYGRLVGKVLRMVTFSAPGKLMDQLIGDQVILSRSRALDPAGVLDNVPFRILDLRHNWANGISQCTAVADDIQFLI